MRRFGLGIGSFALFLSSGQAAATPINVSAFRAVQFENEGVNWFGPSSPSTALGFFTDSLLMTVPEGEPVTFRLVHADQVSDIQPGVGRFYGAGFAMNESNSGTSGLASVFTVRFDVTTPHSYSLAGELFDDGGLGGASFGLFGPTSFTFSTLGLGTTSLTSTGVLAPGIYGLAVNSLVTGAGPSVLAAFSFDFQIEEIKSTPEPATFILLAFGLTGLGLMRRGTASSPRDGRSR